MTMARESADDTKEEFQFITGDSFVISLII